MVAGVPSQSVLPESEEDRQILEMVRDFACNELAPRVTEYDRAEQLPLDLLERIAELGLLGGVIPTELGGAGLGHVTFAAIVEEISKVCQIMGTIVSMPSGLVGVSIQRFGRPDQLQRWLRPLAQGSIFGAAAVTEPRSGSDVAGMQATYRTEGDEFVLNGAKAWISNLDIASFFLTFATHDRSLGRSGVTAFIVPRESAGLTLNPYKDKLGFRPLCTGDVFFDELRLPADAVLGEPGRGFEVAMTAVEKGRLGVGARSVGVAQACLEDTVAFARDREAATGTIANYQLVQGKVTDMQVGTTTARLLVRHCAAALERGERARQLTSMAKMYASDVAARSAADAVQVHGAAGVSSELRVGRMYRDAKVLQIVEGSNDLHRALIGEMELGLRSNGEGAGAAKISKKMANEGGDGR